MSKRSIKYLLITLLVFFSSCALPRKPNLDEMLRVKRLIEEARIKMAAGELDEAESYINLAQEIYPQDVVVLDAKGCLAWRRKLNDLAESYFKEALLLDPTFENSYVNLAIVVEQRGDVLGARRLLKKALELNPLNHKARNNYAGILFDYALTREERDSARKELSKAVHSAPELDGVLKYNVDKFNRSRARLN